MRFNFDSLKALNDFRMSVLLSGEASLRMSFDFVGGETVLLFFRMGEGELCRFKSIFRKGDAPLANRSLAVVTVSSGLSLADFAGECSLILVGFPGPMVMYVLTPGSSAEPLNLVADTLLADRRRGPTQSGSTFSLEGDEHRPAPRMKPFSDLLEDASLALVGL